MAAVAMPAPAPTFSPGPRTSTAASAPSASLGGPPHVPTDLTYGVRVGIRSCAEQRYVAAFPRAGGGTGAVSASGSELFELEVSGFHPFRLADAADRVADCPSEWVLLHYSARQHRGQVQLGDEVCFAKEMTVAGEKRKDRYAYLALGPTAEGNAMEPTIERREGSGDLCRWTLLHADEPNKTGAVQACTPLLIRGKYNECLALGKHLWDGIGAGSGVRSPARASGR
mmetsp:Transcript_84434/g.187542  ORF Transcript_84434/g.187542 Transcript_84434/m.187542 type:complete len:227 (+) Transcript_84434:49-729(+)